MDWSSVLAKKSTAGEIVRLCATICQVSSRRGAEEEKREERARSERDEERERER